MTLTISNPPGFSDISDTSLDAGKFALGIIVGKISDNAEFGQVRLEVFQATYKHGDTVAIPTSAADGYVYSRDELSYLWTVQGSVNPATGWISGPDCLWYCNWYVDQTTGLVTSEEWYRRSGSNDQAARSNDGVILVFTVAQRQKASMAMSKVAYFSDIDDAEFHQDKALNTSLAKQLSANSKFSCVNTELIYMGEYVDGNTVAKPVSPVDGYVYSYAETAFLPCWKWTTANGAYTQPPKADGQLATLKASVDGTNGAVSVSVAMVSDGTVTGGATLTTYTTFGRVAVFAVCNRAVNQAQFQVLGTSMPWDPSLASNSALPFDKGLGFTAPSVSPLVVAAGESVVLERVSGTVDANGSGTFYDGNGGPGMSGHSNFPSDWIVPYTLGLGALIGCFTDDTGKVIGSPFQVGNGPVTKTAPSGATRVSLGVNDDNYGDPMVPGDNFGSFQAKMTVASFAVYGMGDDFAEIDASEFYPGAVLKNTDLLQVSRNARQGALSPEVFGPTSHADGDTIALPTSPIDGYAYARSELSYLWTWKDTTNQTGSHLRMPLFHGAIDQSTGVVTLNVWRLPPGGPGVDDNNTLARITVVVLGQRQRTASTSAAVDPNPPTDQATIPADLPDGSTDTVNGV